MNAIMYAYVHAYGRTRNNNNLFKPAAGRLLLITFLRIFSTYFLLIK